MRLSRATGSGVLAVALLFATAGCGSSGSSNTADTNHATGRPATTAQKATGAWPNTSLQACDLLTDAQVASAVGMKVDPGKADNETPGSRGCNWMTAAGDTGAGPDKIASITLEVSGPNPALAKQYPTAQSYFDSLKELYAGSMQSVAGVGDEAIFTSSQHWLWAIKGDVVLRVFATFGSSATTVPRYSSSS